MLGLLNMTCSSSDTYVMSGTSLLEDLMLGLQDITCSSRDAYLMSGTSLLEDLMLALQNSPVAEVILT